MGCFGPSIRIGCLHAAEANAVLFLAGVQDLLTGLGRLDILLIEAGDDAAAAPLVQYLSYDGEVEIRPGDT